MPARPYCSQTPGAPAPADPRWTAVLARDAKADGTFVYAVRTTGVYCRSTCPARRPKRENVVFFATPADAVGAGFRACKRCRPDRAETPADRDTALVARLCRWIETREEAVSLAEVAAQAGLSASHTRRVFRAVTGLTPKEWADAYRARRFRDALAAGAGAGAVTVTHAIYGAGFSSSSRVYERTDGLLGMTPSAFRKGGDHQRIRFAVGDCTLGAFLVAATPRGVCALELGDDPEVLVHELERRFPAATLVGADPAFERLVALVAGLVDRPWAGVDPSLPLDLRGTAFQHRVWAALNAIPAGTTTTYAALAAAIGQPTATRAVARACAANPVAVAVPCHRVVRADGALAGYRWGIARKQRLLDCEAAARGSAQAGG